jgi:hypothetical protein
MVSPFDANYGFEPCNNWLTEVQFRTPASELYRHCMNHVHQKQAKQLKKSIKYKRKYYHKKRKNTEPVLKGEFVMLDRKNLRPKHH